MINFFSISYVHPDLRNFLIRNDIPFKKPRKQGGNLKVKDCRIKKDYDEKSVRFCSGDRVIEEMPEYAAYIQNLFTTKADLMRKKSGRKNQTTR